MTTLDDQEKDTVEDYLLSLLSNSDQDRNWLAGSYLIESEDKLSKAGQEKLATFRSDPNNQELIESILEHLADR